ncbi:major histocompatibility complex class I-related gene protein-like [Elgaria multicarinata webbii]|uniref:major histocompatibility complex class I-related gene protein-like n=1 Tax=Elgaria multicarinata webbii TaxID=159646 RepID=UPI002FCD6152
MDEEEPHETCACNGEGKTNSDKVISNHVRMKKWQAAPDIFQDRKHFVKKKAVEKPSENGQESLLKRDLFNSVVIYCIAAFSGVLWHLLCWIPPRQFLSLWSKWLAGRKTPVTSPGSIQAGQFRWHQFFLVSALLLEGCSGSSSHTLHYSYTYVSEPSQGLPHLSIDEYVDDQLVAHYDSNTQSYFPRTTWMEELKEEDPDWHSYTDLAQNAEDGFKINLVTLGNYYNHSEGFHTLHWMYGCELSEDGHKSGYDQDAYDGRDFISFDKETLTWTAASVEAQRSKRNLEKDPSFAKHVKHYLEEICIGLLEKRLDHGKEVLLKKDPPVGKVTCMAKATHDGVETLVCRAHGFYPKEIDATWTRDGENMDHATFRKSVATSSDGTYHTWLGIEIDPKERDLYQCHLDHAGLPEPLVLAWEEPEGWQVTMCVIGGVLAAVLLVTGIVYWIRKQQKRKIYKAAWAW